MIRRVIDKGVRVKLKQVEKEHKIMNFTKNNVQQKFIVLGVTILVAVGGLIGFGVSSYSTEEEEAEVAALPWEEEGPEDNSEEQAEVEPSFYVVDVKGEVTNPGVYTVKDGERVHDVIEQAGGFTGEALKEAINLAERCYDEMVIVVPKEGEEAEISDISGVSESPSNEGILLNQATDTELTELPGIGPSKAEAIVAYRDENGPFQNVEDLVEVPGIGEKTLESIKEFLIVR